MKGTNVQRKTRKVKYVYDYPENRRVSEHLTSEDKQFIAERTGFGIRYVCAWCQGTRRSRSIAELAKQISRINIAKQRKLNKPNQSTCSRSKPTSFSKVKSSFNLNTKTYQNETDTKNPKSKDSCLDPTSIK